MTSPSSPALAVLSTMRCLRAVSLAPAVALPALLAAPCLASPSRSPRPGAPARLVFASYAVGAAQARKAAVLVESIRAFAGAHREAPVFVVADEAASAVLEQAPDPSRNVLRLDMPDRARRLPYAAKAFAAAQVERAVGGSAETMIWLDPESVLLAPPEGLLLSGRQAVAMQPVFLLNTVGLPPGQQLDRYWSRIYQEVGLRDVRVPAVRAVVDGNPIRFYINCGVIAYRPSRGLCAEWARALTALIEDVEFRSEATADPQHAVFLHQAVISAVICARTRPAEWRWIPITHGYPLQLHDRVPSGGRVARLNDVVCLIYDQAWDQDAEWLSRVPVDEPLRGWLSEARRATFRLTDRIHRQEGQCNTYLVQVGDGWVVVDPGDADGPSNVLRRIAGADRLHAIVLTHGHADHRGGIDAWKSGRDVPVIAHHRHAELLADQDRIAGLLAARGATLAGKPAPASQSAPRTVNQVTRSFGTRQTLGFGDRRFELIPVGGETPDTTLVWIPEERALLAADDFYSEFPNLSTLRGSKPRWALEYVRAMDEALALGPELLLPGHGEPVIGAHAVTAALTRYRDAILYVHDAVVSGLNQGRDVHSLMREIGLPEALRLGEGYGRVSWAVRGIYESYAGWFDGRTASMYSEPASSVYPELTALAGGSDRLAAKALELKQAGELVRALHLTDVALAAAPTHRPTIEARLEVLRALLSRATNYFERAWLREDIRASTAAAATLQR